MKALLLAALIAAPAIAEEPKQSSPEPAKGPPTVGAEVLYFAAHHGPSEYLMGVVDGVMQTIPGQVHCKFGYIDLGTYLAQMGSAKPEILDSPLALAISVIISKQCEHGQST